VSLELLVLGVISAIRPATSQAAVFALLNAPAARRSLLAFTLAGLTVSTAIGLVIVVAFDGAGGALGRSSFSAVFDLVAGVAAVAFAAGVQRGRLTRPRATPRARPESRIAARLRRPSPATAAAAGIATHIPGLIYLVVLNAIAATQPGPGSAVVQVTTYNLLWFAVPLAALALAILAPDTAGAYLDRLTAWARRHQERLLVLLFGGLGVYLTAKGIANLT
jgi:hypothetical protein